MVDVLLTGVMAPPTNKTYEDGFDEVLTLWLDNVCRTLAEAGLPVSDHRDNHSPDSKTGCGAADGLGAILAVLGARPEGLDALLSGRGIDPADSALGRVAGSGRSPGLSPPNGARPHRRGYARNPIPVLDGAHGEVGSHR